MSEHAPYQFFDLKSFPGQGDAFMLTPIELKDYIRFEPKRLYYITDMTGATGQHCHYIEQEFFIAMRGTMTAIIDRGQGKERIPMKAGQAIYVDAYVWHGFEDGSEDAVLLAVSSTNYNPDRSDYLEDYDKYLELRDEHLAV